MCDFVSLTLMISIIEKSGIYPIKGMTDMMVIKGVQKHLRSQMFLMDYIATNRW